MRIIKQFTSATILFAMVALITGCDTPTGALSGAAIGGVVGGLAARHDPAAGALIGAATGAVIGGVIGKINEDQRAKLQAESPQTWQTIQHNDQVAQRQAAPAPATAAPAPAPAPGQGQPAAQEEAPIPLKVDDIKAMTAAGIKPQAIIDAIKESKTVYSSTDINAVQQANPPVDPTVVSYMKNPTA